MNFFEAQDEARRRSRKLVWLFIVAIFCTGLSIHAAVVILLHWGDFSGPFDWKLAEIGLFPLTLGGALLVIAIGAWHKSQSLSGGGSAVAEALGGTRVDPASIDPAERRLLNVVEEMALASGTPVPAVFLLDQEEAINAFAAGLETSDAVVAVSRGCMRRLTRDELQGVVAHEFSHILNGDMRLNFRMIVWVAGIFCLAILGRGALEVGIRMASRSSGSRNQKKEKSAAAGFLVLSGLILLIVGAVGTFFGRLIQSAVSRQREYLADASAVQFTRLSAGISGALKKIGGFEKGSVLAAPRAAEVSHMMFGESLKGFFSRLFFATHPPIEDRIRALEPGWSGSMLPAPELADEDFAVDVRPDTFVAELVRSPRSQSEPSIELGRMPDAAEFGYARDLIHSLPDAAVLRARDSIHAPEILLELVRAAAVEEQLKSTVDVAGPDWVGTSLEQRMALIHIAMPAVRMRGPADIQKVVDGCESAIMEDGQVNLMELSVVHAVRRHLSIAAGIKKPASVKYRALESIANEVRTVLSAVAMMSSSDEAVRDAAFAGAWARLGLPLAGRRAEQEMSVAVLDAALNECEASALRVRKTVLEACMRASSHDGVWMPMERLLVRAIADAIGSPLPPILG